MACLFDHFSNEQDKLLHRTAQLARERSFDAAIRQASFIRENTFGVVLFDLGYGTCVKAERLEEALRQIPA